jgi:hypothetical protein
MSRPRIGTVFIPTGHPNCFTDWIGREVAPLVRA